MRNTRKTDYRPLILIFVALKVALNMLAMPHFGFHRDELLHLVLADHLDWGYKEVPPAIAVLAYITKHLFGASVFAARVFPTICAGLIVWLTGLITIELGGRRLAITLACGSIILAPAFAASEYLFQPVVFDQFWWVLSAWLLVKYVNTRNVSWLYWLGVAVGFGMLTKYTMAFFAFALLLGLLISNQRRVMLNRHLWGAIGLTTIIFLPNIIWQFAHHLPFFTHMRELKEEQLNYLSPVDFVLQQLIVNGIGVIIWLTGLAVLLFYYPLRKYRFLAFAYLLVFLFLLKMNGKVYYLFGAYPMLFAAGGCMIDNLLKRANPVWHWTVGILLLVPHFLFIPIVLPIFSLKQTVAIFKYDYDHFPFTRFAIVWEDRKEHATTQDYADMLSWDELAQKVSTAYYKLTPEQQKHTIIYGSNYGEAGALHQYGKQYNLPEVVSLNSSFALWAPDSIQCDYMIYVDNYFDSDMKGLTPMVESVQKVGEITTPYAREHSNGIYLLTHPKPELLKRYADELAKKRLE